MMARTSFWIISGILLFIVSLLIIPVQSFALHHSHSATTHNLAVALSWIQHFMAIAGIVFVSNGFLLAIFQPKAAALGICNASGILLSLGLWRRPRLRVAAVAELKRSL